MMNVATALKLVATTEFRPFTESDWHAWQGCNSKNPLIGENGKYAIIIDGDEVTFCDDEVNWFIYKLNFLSSY